MCVCESVHSISIKETIWHQGIPISEKAPVAEKVLALTIEDGTVASIQNALDRHMAAEPLDNYGLEGRRVQAEVRKEITAASDVLVVVLKRYKFLQATQTSSKIRRVITLTSPLAIMVRDTVVS